MNKYRVKMVDDFQGRIFSFAIYVYSAGLFGAEDLAKDEFPTADVVKIDLVAQNTGMEYIS